MVTAYRHPFRVGPIRLAVAVAVALLSRAGAGPALAQAPDQAGPAFPCARAATRIEHLLCSPDADPALPWLDRELDILYAARRAAPGTDTTALSIAQRNWLASRNRCDGDGDDAALSRCLSASYWSRIAALAAPSDPSHLTGSYRAPAIRGRLRAVQLPDGATTLALDADTGPPSFNGCSLSTTLFAANDRLRYDATAAGDTGDAGCAITLVPSPNRFTVSSAHCPAFCGAGATLDGTYTRSPP